MWEAEVAYIFHESRSSELSYRFWGELNFSRLARLSEMTQKLSFSVCSMLLKMQLEYVALLSKVPLRIPREFRRWRCLVCSAQNPLIYCNKGNVMLIFKDVTMEMCQLHKFHFLEMICWMCGRWIYWRVTFDYHSV